MVKNWRREIARDVMALGSIPFYFIVIIRAIIGKYAPFVCQLMIALIILFILSRIKNSNRHIARGLVLVVFTSLFYQEMLYTIFAFLLWFFMIISSIYLKIKGNEMARGILFGIISVIVGYYLTSLLIAS